MHWRPRMIRPPKAELKTVYISHQIFIPSIYTKMTLLTYSNVGIAIFSPFDPKSRDHYLHVSALWIQSELIYKPRYLKEHWRVKFDVPARACYISVMQHICKRILSLLTRLDASQLWRQVSNKLGYFRIGLTDF